MIVRTVVVGHYSRKERAEKLAEDLGASLFLDSGQLGARRNHMLAWKTLAYRMLSKEDWALVIEDDAEPVEGFQDELKAALIRAPSPVVSLYLGRARPPHWQASIAEVVALPDCWLVAREMLHGVAIAVRGDMVFPMVQGVRDVLGHQKDLPVDEAIGVWCRRSGYLVSYTHPSLVDHADIPSVISEHLSGHDGDSTSYTSFPEDPRVPRRAWVTGSRDGKWDSFFSCIRTPEPL